MAKLLSWAEMFPEGRFIFYEGDDPVGFRKEIKARFNFDPGLDNQRWNKRCGYYFHCPAKHLDAIYTEYQMGS